MKIRLLLLLFVLSVSTAIAQKTVTTSNADSTLTIKADNRFEELVDKQKKQNLANPTMVGYRIQIYFGGNRQKATEVKIDFSSRYPNVSAYLTYQQPNFKVRIGDFRSRYEAQNFLKEINGVFPTSFIVPEDVKLPPVK